MNESSKNRVFLSYAKENLVKVKEVYDGLIKRGLNVWFDNEHLEPGPWKPQIEKAISKCRYFVICISEAALRKTGDERPGFQDEELNRAYDIAEKHSDKNFEIVPVRLEDCGRGDFRLSDFQQYDLFIEFEKHLDKLAVHLGGSSLSDRMATDERTEDEKMIESLMGRAEAANFAAEYDKSITILNSILVLKPDSTDALNNLGAAWNAKGKYEKSLKSNLNTFDKSHPNMVSHWYNPWNVWKALWSWYQGLPKIQKIISFVIGSLGLLASIFQIYDHFHTSGNHMPDTHHGQVINDSIMLDTHYGQITNSELKVYTEAPSFTWGNVYFMHDLQYSRSGKPLNASFYVNTTLTPPEQCRSIFDSLKISFLELTVKKDLKLWKFFNSKQLLGGLRSRQIEFYGIRLPKFVIICMEYKSSPESNNISYRIEPWYLPSSKTNDLGIRNIYFTQFFTEKIYIHNETDQCQKFAKLYIDDVLSGQLDNVDYTPLTYYESTHSSNKSNN